MRRKLTHAEYVAQVNALNKGITVVGTYQQGNKKLTHRCAEGHEWDAEPRSIKEGRACPHCSGRVVTHADYVAQVAALGNGIKVTGQYVNDRVKITHQCAHGHKWDAPPSKIKQGSGCPHCAEHVSENNVFYIWENVDDPGVYKIGITSKRRGTGRIAQCFSRNKMTGNIILMAAVDDARDIEHRAKLLGEDPCYPDTLDGYTEFRRYSDAELGAVYQMAVQAA